MKIAIIGAGAIGSVAAGLLFKAGVDVVLIGKQGHIDSIKKNGLRIKGVINEKGLRLPVATRLSQKYDLTIFTVKTMDLEKAYGENHEFLEDALVMTTQNGVQADNILSCHFEREKMISSIVMFGATYTKPGEVTYNFPGAWIIGQPFTVNTPVVSDVAEILEKAFDVTISKNIMGMKWLKLFVNLNNCIPALTGKSMQETFQDMDLCRLSVRLLKEGYTATQKTGIELVPLPNFPVEKISGLAQMPEEQAAAIIHKTLTGLSKEPLYGSILQSIMRHRISEIDYINGEIVLIAKHMRMPAPLNEKVVDLVHAVENTGRFMKPADIKKEFNLN